MDDIQDAKACLESVDCLVQVRSGLLGLQQSFLLFYKSTTDLRHACIERSDLLAQIRSVRLDGEER